MSQAHGHPRSQGSPVSSFFPSTPGQKALSRCCIAFSREKEVDRCTAGVPTAAEEVAEAAEAVCFTAEEAPGEELPCFVAAGIPGAFAVAAAFLIIVVFLARVSAFMANGYPSWDDWDYGYYGGPSDGVQNAQALSTRAVQTALAWRGYYRGRIDGVMGPETRDAIRSFQAHQSLPVTGQIDHGLLNALRRGGSNDHKTT
jgi:hypothetical protein